MKLSQTKQNRQNHKLIQNQLTYNSYLPNKYNLPSNSFPYQIFKNNLLLTNKNH